MNAARFSSQRRLRPGEQLPDHLGDEDQFPVSVMCEVLGVSRSSYHGWVSRAPSDRALSDTWLTSRITETHQNARAAYRSRRGAGRGPGADSGH